MSAAPAPPVAAALLEMRLHDDVPAEATGAAVRAVATAYGVSPERATRLRVVVEELVREARQRERFAGAEDQIVVRIDHEATSLRVEVVDRRLPVVATESRHLPSRRLAAMGFVESLHVANRGKEGNVVECRVRPDPPAEELHGVEQLPDDAADAPADLADRLEIRPMAEADAGALVRCVFRCYGYSYKDGSLYEPRSVRRALARGEQVSVVAALPDGEVVGHAAYFFEEPTDRVPEAGRLVVDPRFRGHHLAERLAQLRMAVAGERSIPGLWAECVANHPASQRGVLAVGGAEVGLLIGASPAGVVMAGLANSNEGRRSLVATYTPVSPAPARPVHLPERHADLLRTLAHRVGCPRDVRTDVTVPAEAASVVHLDLLASSGLAHLRVDRVGADLVERVEDELEGLVPFELGATHLDVALADPAAAWAVESLEALGFCWAAWVPEFRADGDVVRLQRVGEHAVDVEHVVCARPEGEALRDHVVAEWHRVRRRPAR
ncbi:GNAT family N-acetyltransferase [Rhabdothermincola salaria]|uniref:GNAT family N-acetyltransferase n=1 Tax=Rhabdothermincola salaria TaxID=2903142 RepID=UPI001E4588ED|nr:GNAT family N-acetyltransferase [Rhabdothermincola salaria]MCD9624861.1 GNAT family N-acetyltransferase [Rhabdothermincola salaria]